MSPSSFRILLISVKALGKSKICSRTATLFTKENVLSGNSVCLVISPTANLALLPIFFPICLGRNEISLRPEYPLSIPYASYPKDSSAKIEWPPDSYPTSRNFSFLAGNLISKFFNSK